MGKVRTPLTIDEDVLRAVKAKAARTNRSDGEVIEEALRRALGLEPPERLWRQDGLPEDEALQLAVDAQHKLRRRR